MEDMGFPHCNKPPLQEVYYCRVIIMDKQYDDRVSRRMPGRKNPPVPWDDKKDAGMSLGELLKEKIEDIIDVDNKLV